MDSMKANDWVTAGIAVAALIVAIMSWWASHRAASAAEDASRQAKRSADADEAMAEFERQDRAAAELERIRNPWVVQKISQTRFAIEFTGDAAFLAKRPEHAARVTVERPKGKRGPILNGEVLVMTVVGTAHFDNRVRFRWTTSQEPDAEVFEQILVTPTR